MVVLEDAGRAVMRVAAALRAVAASADATAGRMEIIFSGSGFKAGGCRQRVVIQGVQVSMWPAAACREASGCGPHETGWAGLGCFNLRGHAPQCPRGGTVRPGCIRAPGRAGVGLWGSPRWACWGRWVQRACCGAWGSVWRGCGGRRVRRREAICGGYVLAFRSGGRFSVAGLGPCALGEFGPFVRDRPEIAFLRLGGMRVSEWGQMPHRRMVQTILTSVTAHTMGCQ